MAQTMVHLASHVAAALRPGDEVRPRKTESGLGFNSNFFLRTSCFYLSHILSWQEVELANADFFCLIQLNCFSVVLYLKDGDHSQKSQSLTFTSHGSQVPRDNIRFCAVLMDLNCQNLTKKFQQPLVDRELQH